MPDVRDLSVLLVDDDEDVLMLLAAVLKRDARFDTVTTCEDVKGARRALESSCPDVIVLDLRLRRSSGLELLPQVRSACRESVVVVHSAYAELHPEAAVYVDAVIPKGGRVLGLPQRLHDLVSARRAHD